MVKAIPIFEFAFAAYAATVRGGSERIRSPQAPRQLFETAWRSTAQRDGVLMVKIGVLDNGRAEATALTPCETILPVKDIWLGQIKEIDGGYCGVVCMIQAPLRTIRLGQTIEFGPSHILDWTISYEGSAECGATPRSASSRAEACGACVLAEEALG
jgi:hypothetical protein